MSDAPTECMYCNYDDPDCGFCDMGEPLDTQEDWDNSWGRLIEGMPYYSLRTQVDPRRRTLRDSQEDVRNGD